MPTQEKHALLSASSAARWLKCTAAPRFEEQFPAAVSEYAEEGRLAHAICELKTVKKFTLQISPRTFTSRLNKLKKDPLYNEEMNRTSDLYLEHLTERAMTYATKPYVAAEVRVDLSDYIPEGFGTCDCIMIGGDTLTITDYKHGKGVPVSAENNPQTRLYALGALKKYAPIYGSNIKNINMVIDQPRIQEDVSVEAMKKDDLLDWGESIKPIAAKAYAGLGEFIPGEHCRFCRGKAECAARASTYSALEEFKDCVPFPGKLTRSDIGDLLTKGRGIVKWYKDLEEYALSETLKGVSIPGWKVVEGRSNRVFTDQDAAIDAVIAAGYDKALVYDYKPKTLAEIEKLMGKTDFAAKIGGFVVKPPGKPTLVPVDDKREPYNPAAQDFGGLTP